MDNSQSIEFICKNYNTDQDIANKVMQKPISYLTKNIHT